MRSSGEVGWLAWRARLAPNQTCLIYNRVAATYAQMADASAKLAVALAHAGVGPGQGVAMLTRNTPSNMAMLFASQAAGFWLSPLNSRLTASELAHQLAVLQPSAVVADAAFAELAAESIAEGTATTLMTVDEWGSSLGSPLGRSRRRALSEAGPLSRPDGDPIILVLFTSGTTGRPKAVTLTRSNLYASAAASAMHLGVAPDDRWLCCLPLHHVGGLSILIRSVLFGHTVILHPDFDAARVTSDITRHAATMISLVPTTLGRLLDQPGDPEWTKGLRCVLVGGAACPGDLLDRALSIGIPALTTYGLTESCSQVATAPPGSRPPQKATGLPLPAVEVRIEGAQENATGQGPGEILIRGPMVSPGQLDSGRLVPGLTDGWLATGDLGWQDSDGWLYLQDRRSDLIVSGGENIMPSEVEAAIIRHPAVREALVYGLDDPQWGQSVAAAVVLQPEASMDMASLRDHLQQLLAGYKIPRRLVITDSLPMTTSGKVSRSQMRRLDAKGNLKST